MPFPSDLVQTHPGLSILRLAALIADGSDEADDDALDAMFQQSEAGAFDGALPAQIWPELARGLAAPFPSKMIRALRDCAALPKALPEVAALFGVLQISDDPVGVDLGEHIMAALDEAARRDAPLAVRFALLTMNVGKADSPPEHLPAHYRHIERGRPRIEAICARFEVPADCRDLALLALAECERVHRASEVRAGPVAAMLERLGAFDVPQRFGLLMSVCACDYCAYGDRAGRAYPKATLLEAARAACEDLGPAKSLDELRLARAEAIARAFRSQRWSDADQ